MRTGRKTAGTPSRKSWLFFTLAFLLPGLLLPLFSCSAHSDSGRTLSIVYANRINGQLDPCG